MANAELCKDNVGQVPRGVQCGERVVRVMENDQLSELLIRHAPDAEEVVQVNCVKLSCSLVSLDTFVVTGVDVNVDAERIGFSVTPDTKPTSSTSAELCDGSESDGDWFKESMPPLYTSFIIVGFSLAAIALGNDVTVRLYA